jgi:hypothetical protein
VSYAYCYECGHVYETAADLLAGHNANLEDYGEPRRTELDDNLAGFCADCLHSF